MRQRPHINYPAPPIANIDHANFLILIWFAFPLSATFFLSKRFVRLVRCGKHSFQRFVGTLNGFFLIVFAVRLFIAHGVRPCQCSRYQILILNSHCH
jgi:hypothetical protein